MSALLWTLVIVHGLGVLQALAWLSNGSIPKRTPTFVAVNAAVECAFMGWALWLIAKGAA